MKKLMLSFVSVLAFATFSFAQEAEKVAPVNPNQADFKFEKEVNDFGTIKEGIQATYDFKFTNTGKEPLLITNVQASCGCTTPKWSKEPIKKGESGIITAVYNSTGRPGAFNKSITITSNAKTASKVLYIKGTVEPKPAAATSLSPVKGESGPTEKKTGSSN